MSTIYTLEVDADRTRRHNITAPTSGVAIAIAMSRYTAAQRDGITRVEVISATPLPQEVARASDR